MEVKATATPEAAPLQHSERRSDQRRNIYLPVRLRPSDPREHAFDDVRSSVNASSRGVYFTTWCGSYRVGMPLLVTFPCSPVPAVLNVDYLGRVVRLEQLSDGRLGVAVELLAVLPNGSGSLNPK